MNQMTEFFSGLLNTDKWPARWNCGYWSPFHGWLYIISDLLIWLAYFLIPVIIINYFSKKKNALKFNKTYIYFAAFIVLCGTTHFMDALMFWLPVYRLNALLRLATAIISLMTVYHLIKILPAAFSQKTNVELEEEISRRKQAEKKLEEANAGLANFASMASHDLQEPLRKIQAFTEILNERNEKIFDESSKQYADKISGACTRMQLLIGDIFTLSSIPSDIELKQIDPGIAIQKAIEELELKIKEKDAVIETGKLPLIRGNEAYLIPLFVNLLSNALKFSVNPPIIKLTGEQSGDMVNISVADNGIGISELYFTKIFDVFQRLHSRSQYEGTGIGLTICKNIMSAHKGNITLDSKPGAGTTFTLKFMAGNPVIHLNA